MQVEWCQVVEVLPEIIDHSAQTEPCSMSNRNLHLDKPRESIRSLVASRVSADWSAVASASGVG